jgi:thiamine biosynthesis lipoprotein
MGTVVTITVLHPDRTAAAEMVRMTFNEMSRLEAILTRHDRDGVVYRLNRDKRLGSAPPEVIEVLTVARTVSERTDGAFDVTALPLLEVLERSFAERGGPPTDREVDRARSLVDYRGIEINGREVALRPEMSVTVDGIAKGFIVDRTRDLLHELGAQRVLVNAGGDIAAMDLDGGAPWTVAIQNPESPESPAEMVQLRGGSIATSGDYMRTFTNDRRYHHILDPRSGRSADAAASVSVLHRSAMWADALSTAYMVLGPEAGSAVQRQYADHEALGRNAGIRGAKLFGMIRTRVCDAWVCLLLMLVLVGRPSVAEGQAASRSGDAPPAPNLFAADSIVHVTIEADFSALVGDRTDSPDREGLVVADGSSLPVRIRTRGEFRLDPANCAFPPLRIELDEAAQPGSLMQGQDELKIVSSCRPGRPAYDQLVFLEYLAYRTYSIITDEAFRVRLVELTLVDRAGVRETATRPAFFIEEDQALAERLGGAVFDLEEGSNLPSAAFQARARTRSAIFLYMIGNTDWSAVAGHNVEILDVGGGALPVPYDFDSSGIVDAPYATIAPDLGLSNVRERRYRGWCSNSFVTAQVLEEFREKREPILGLWRSTHWLDEDGRARSVRYLESFYDDIETDERAHRRFLRDCRN